jgi:hypothetical protein
VEGELTRISHEAGRGALAPRHAKCEMRGDESLLTIKAICFEGAIFEVSFSCMKSEIIFFIFDKK